MIEFVYLSDFIDKDIDLEVHIKGKNNEYEIMDFSFSKWLKIEPKAYRIISIKHIEGNAFEILQKVDFNSGKISLHFRFCENQESNSEEKITLLMNKITEKLLNQKVTKVTINTTQGGSNRYYIDLEISELMIKPDSTIDFKKISGT